MAHSRLLFVVHCIVLLYCIIWGFFSARRCMVVDFDQRPATVSITRQSSDGAEIWGYVQVRKGAHLFWSYYKSPHRVSSPGEPWPTILYAASAASSGHGNFNGIEAVEPRNSTWLRHADLLVVDTPVGTGNSYEDDASGNRVWSLLAQTFPLQAAVDILVLLRALTRDDREIATLQSSSPLILLHSTYGGTYAGRISTVVRYAIWAGALNSLTYGGLVDRFDGRSTPQRHQITVDTRPRICLADPADDIRAKYCTRRACVDGDCQATHKPGTRRASSKQARTLRYLVCV